MLTRYRIIQYIIEFGMSTVQLVGSFQVGQNPPLSEKDPHWYIGVPDELPYTVASLPYRTATLDTTGELLRVPESKQMIVPSLCGGSHTNLASLGNLSISVSRLSHHQSIISIKVRVF